MKRLSAFFWLLMILVATIAAHEDDLFWDIDSLFDESWAETPAEEYIDEPAMSVLSTLKRRGLTVDASYEFQGGIVPGWDTAPWHFTGEEVYSWGPAVKMDSRIGLDAQVSEVFRIFTVFTFSIPGSSFSLGDFFFDYNILNTVFVRAGKYEHSWGVSPNYSFANLLARVPYGSAGGVSHIFKTDIPIGIGGFQALAVTRADLTGSMLPGWNDIGYGGKYNLAFRWADFDMGVFYQDNMALRTFLSVNTTIGNTELYNEWLAAVNIHSDKNTGFAANVGFIRDFFGSKLTVNGELFFNGEGNSYFYRPETGILEADTLPFIKGFNLAFNMIYRFSAKGSPRFFMQVLSAPAQSTAQLIPGFRLSPLSHAEIYLAVPMALGSKDGYYYTHTADPKSRPFSIMLLVTLKGSIQAGYYY